MRPILASWFSTRPDRRQREILGLTLLHEWLHLVAFGSPRDLRRFDRASGAEPLAPATVDPIDFGVRKTQVHEAWCELGETLFGYDDAAARQAALAAPLHVMILWRCVEKILRKAPPRWRSTRFAEFEARASFMRGEVEPPAQKVRAKRTRKDVIFGEIQAPLQRVIAKALNFKDISCAIAFNDLSEDISLTKENRTNA